MDHGGELVSLIMSGWIQLGDILGQTTSLIMYACTAYHINIIV